MTTQMNYQGGVNKKTTPSTATCGEAETGESKRSVQIFSKNIEAPKARTPRPGPQKNFPNGN